MSNQTQKVAIVTGASRGIGKAIALNLSQGGYSIVCVSRSHKDLEKVVEEIKNRGGKAMAIPFDVSKLEDFQTCVKQVVDTYGKVDVLINNAGMVRDKVLLRMSEIDWDVVMNVNLKGCFNGIKAVTPVMMRNRFGRIINITSVVGIIGNAGQANYASSKAGIIGLTKSAAKELASRNITVNAVAPGYIETDMTTNLSEKIREELMKQIPLHRIGTPDDVAYVVSFLTTEQANYITGQTISVNGGLYM